MNKGNTNIFMKVTVICRNLSACYHGPRAMDTVALFEKLSKLSLLLKLMHLYLNITVLSKSLIMGGHRI